MTEKCVSPVIMKNGLDKTKVPSHIAIIMDGNRRWARERGLEDSKGHEAGVANLEKVIKAASEIGVKNVTIYALSTENLKERSKREISALFKIIQQFYRTRLVDLVKKGVRAEAVGDITGLPKSIQRLINKLRNTYIKNESIRVNMALNYGGKKELLKAVKEIIKQGVDIDKV